jgi:type I restriction-modification system DNA methylase subunit
MRVVVLLVLFFISVISFAQKDEKKKTIEEKSVEVADELKKDLGLSEEQYEKVRLIYVKYLKEKDELNTKIKELEHRKKAIKTTRNNMINSALTPEQKKELEKQKNKKKRKK